jgi:branched-chain amino acid transport system permease protein
MIIVLFFRKGIMGTKEFTWKSIFKYSDKKPLEEGGNK